MNNKLNCFDKVIFYGAGTHNLRNIIFPFMSAGYRPLYICDADISKHNTTVYGVEIKAPEELSVTDKRFSEYIIVITPRSRLFIAQIQEKLAELRLANATIVTSADFFEIAQPQRNIKTITRISVSLVFGCNLNCTRCDHFSPLASDKDYVDLAEFESEAARLSQLLSQKLFEFQLCGGEPLLHPMVGEFPLIVKKYFPNTDVIMVSNGILLPSMTSEFWENCERTNLTLQISKYPIALDYENLFELCRLHGVNVEYANNVEADAKCMEGLPLNLNGGVNGDKSFAECRMSWCMHMRNGKIYPCACGAFVDIFNNYFNTGLPFENNGVDIYGLETIRDVAQQLSKPMELCSYCEPRKIKPGINWCVSPRQISEWSLT
jgi:ABC-2 type transport system ATP-binding protein